MPIANIISLVFSVGFFVVILICGLVGFIRGTLKSGYFFAATLIVFALGWILMAPISNSMATMDISSFGIVIGDIYVTTPIHLIECLIVENAPGLAFLFQEGSSSFALIQGVIGMGVKIVYFILLLIGFFTIYYLIFGIAWIFIKKPLRKLFKINTEGEDKPKLSMKSRLIGMGIGLSKGLLYALLFSLVFAGIASISNSFQNAASNSQKVAMVCVNDTFTLVELNNEENDDNDLDESSQNSEIFDILGSYSNSVPGKVFGCVKYGEQKSSIDELMFDSIFAIDAKNGNLKLRKELKKVSSILNSPTVQEVMKDGFDISKLYLLEEQELRSLVDLLSSLDVIQILVPVGIEFLAYSDLLVESFGDDFVDIQKLIQDKYDELIELDYCNEVKNIGYAFVNVLQLLGDGLEEDKKIDFFNFDQETLNKIFENLGELELLEIIAPVTINFLINTDAVKTAIESTGFTVEDLGLNGDINYVDELMNLPKIYEKIASLGIQIVDEEVDLSNVDASKIEGFVEVLFDSSIIKNAIPVVATTLVNNYLPEEFSNIFSKEEVDDVNWEDEFAPLLKAAVTLLNSGILNAEDKIVALSQLSDEKINELGQYISESEVFTNNLNDIVEALLKVVLGEDIKYYGLEESKGENWSKDEIISLFNVMKKMSNGLTLEQTDAETEELAIALHSSTYIRKNLNNIINALTSGFGFDVANLEPEEWTINEIYVTFKALNIVNSSSSGSIANIEDFFSMSDEKLDILLESKIIKDSMIRLIVEQSKPGEDLDILQCVYDNGINENGQKVYSWDDEIVDAEFSISQGVITVKEIEGVTKYKVYKNGRYFASIENELTLSISKDGYTYDSKDEFSVKAIKENGEIRNLINGISALNIKDFSQFDFDLTAVNNNKKVILDSYILSNTIVKLVKDLGNDGVVVIPDELYSNNDLWLNETGELSNLIDGLNILLDLENSEEKVVFDDLNEKLSTFSLKILVNNSEELFKSKIISTTIIKEFRGMNENGLIIPAKYMNSYDDWYNIYDENNNLIKEQELVKLLESLDLILTNDSNINDINIDDVFDNILDCFNDEAKTKILLKSVVICDTIQDNVINSTALDGKDYINKSFNTYKLNVNDKLNWYSFDSNGDPERKELWNFMNGLKLLLNGKSYNSLNTIDIDLLVSNENMKPKYNSNCEITESNNNEMLKSIILEEAFVQIVESLCTNGGCLEDLIELPSDFVWYRKDLKSSKEYDLQTFLDSYYLIQKPLMLGADFNLDRSYTNLKSLSDSELDVLATGMVISRTFKNNIATMFNKMLKVNILNQSEYNNASKLAAKQKFISDFKKAIK